jgi:hypothetical protein
MSVLVVQLTGFITPFSFCAVAIECGQALSGGIMRLANGLGVGKINPTIGFGLAQSELFRFNGSPS